MKKILTCLAVCSSLGILAIVLAGCLSTDTKTVRCPGCSATTVLVPACNVTCTKNACPSCGNVQNFTKSATEAVKAYVGDELRAPVHVCPNCTCTVEPCATCTDKEAATSSRK